MTKPILLNVTEVAGLLGVPDTTVHRLAETEGVEPVCLDRHRIRYRKGEVLRWARNRSAAHSAVAEHVNAAVGAEAVVVAGRLRVNAVSAPAPDASPERVASRLAENKLAIRTATPPRLHIEQITYNHGSVSMVVDSPVGSFDRYNARFHRIAGVTADNLGLRSNGTAYYDPDGADPGEAATLTYEPLSGRIGLTREVTDYG